LGSGWSTRIERELEPIIAGLVHQPAAHGPHVILEGWSGQQTNLLFHLLRRLSAKLTIRAGGRQK